MTTLNTQLARLSKVMGIVEDKSHPSIVPPQLLQETKGLMFFKKLTRGKQSSQSSQGVFFKRKEDGSWSQPLAIQIQNSDLYWSNSPRVDRVDVVILVLDDQLVETFKCFGQIGFDENTPNKVKKGVCIENNELSFLKFATVLSERPELINGAAFSYGLSNGHYFPVHLESPVFQFRDSSNSKFYNYKALNMQQVLQEGVRMVDAVKAATISDAQSALHRHFDLAQRFPEYYGKGLQQTAASTTATSARPSHPQMQLPQMSSPDPALGSPDSAGSPSFGRQWSSSTCSSQGSDSDNEFQGYIPRASDLSAMYGSGRGSELGNGSSSWETKKAEPVMSQQEIPVTRTRATSFDFS